MATNNGAAPGTGSHGAATEATEERRKLAGSGDDLSSAKGAPKAEPDPGKCHTVHVAFVPLPLECTNESGGS